MPLHPFLFAAFIVLSFYHVNEVYFDVHVIIVPLLTILLVTGVLLSVALLVRLNSMRAGIITSLIILVASSYGCATDVARTLGTYRSGLFEHNRSYDKMIWVVLIVLLLITVWRAVATKRPLEFATRALNVVSFCIVAVSLASILLSLSREQSASAAAKEIRLQPASPDRTLPNIVYIIPDSYGRNDVLRDLYGFDNSPFTDALQARGFYVASAARSNYCHTTLTLAATLNMDYVPALLQAFDPNARSRRPLGALIRRNRLCTALAEIGYRIVSYESGFNFTRSMPASEHIGPSTLYGEFEREFVDRSLLGPLMTRLIGADHLAKFKISNILFTLEDMPGQVTGSDPVFLFGHIMSPHPPFVFAGQGKKPRPGEKFVMDDGNRLVGVSTSKTQYRSDYVEEVSYLNDRLLACIDGLLRNSARPLVIVLHGDRAGIRGRLE